jgi:hypothetical protein
VHFPNAGSGLIAVSLLRSESATATAQEQQLTAYTIPSLGCAPGSDSFGLLHVIDFMVGEFVKDLRGCKKILSFCMQRLSYSETRCRISNVENSDLSLSVLEEARRTMAFIHLYSRTRPSRLRDGALWPPGLTGIGQRKGQRGQSDVNCVPSSGTHFEHCAASEA